jgi:hypothetical protein
MLNKNNRSKIKPIPLNMPSKEVFLKEEDIQYGYNILKDYIGDKSLAGIENCLNREGKILSKILSEIYSTPGKRRWEKGIEKYCKVSKINLIYRSDPIHGKESVLGTASRKEICIKEIGTLAMGYVFFHELGHVKMHLRGLGKLKGIFKSSSTLEIEADIFAFEMMAKLFPTYRSYFACLLFEWSPTMYIDKGKVILRGSYFEEKLYTIMERVIIFIMQINGE